MCNTTTKKIKQQPTQWLAIFLWQTTRSDYRHSFWAVMILKMKTIFFVFLLFFQPKHWMFIQVKHDHLYLNYLKENMERDRASTQTHCPSHLINIVDSFFFYFPSTTLDPFIFLWNNIKKISLLKNWEKYHCFENLKRRALLILSIVMHFI